MRIVFRGDWRPCSLVLFFIYSLVLCEQKPGNRTKQPKCLLQLDAVVILCMLKTPLAYTQENSVCFSIHSIQGSAAYAPELILLAQIYAPNRLSTGALSQTPLVELTSLSSPPSWFRDGSREREGGRGREKGRKGGEGTEGEGVQECPNPELASLVEGQPDPSPPASGLGNAVSLLSGVRGEAQAAE